jgi:hypothetical protein
MRAHLVAAASILAIAAAFAFTPAIAQRAPQQKISPPEVRYWMGATTGAGMMSMMGAGAGGGAIGIGDALRAARGAGVGQLVELRIGSALAPSGGPEAFHTMPAGAQVNKPIFLRTPEAGRAPGEPGQESYERPRGSIKFYWGCGERAGPGQPVTLTFDKLMRGENDPELAALRNAIDAREVRKPEPGNARTYADWPNQDRRNNGLRAAFAEGASLAGAHEIKGNYTPNINFTLPADKTFMAPIRFTATGKTPAGAIKIDWASVPRATGYSLGVMSGREGRDGGADMVMWSSANRPSTFIINEDLAPNEVQRLIALRAVLAPSTTTCTVPREVIDALGAGQNGEGGAMLWTTAFGDQFTQIHPARPTDPSVTWDQEWFTRVNFKSVRMDMISRDGVQDMSAMMAGRSGGAPRDPAQMSDAEYCAMKEAEARNRPPSAAETIGAATGIPGGGMLGRAIGGMGKKKQDAPPADPRCPAKK